MSSIIELIKCFFFLKEKTLIDQSKRAELPTFESQMKSLESYFKRNIENSILFEPEYLAAKRINKYALKEVISKNDLLRIIDIYNETNSTEHYDGSGWLVLAMYIQGLIDSKGFSSVQMKNNNLKLTCREND